MADKPGFTCTPLSMAGLRDRVDAAVDAVAVEAFPHAIGPFKFIVTRAVSPGFIGPLTPRLAEAVNRQALRDAARKLDAQVEPGKDE